MTLKRLAWAAILSTLLMSPTCGPPPEVKPRLPRLYERRREEIKGLDLSALKGRKIVIDPGHGGVFRGTFGQGRLAEADVNLGVALYLWGLLEEAGAKVWLTRKSDRDFVGGDSTRLRDDLAQRVAIANQVEPDLFISLHHNADFRRDPDRNEIQIYYKMSDPGPSRDVAQTIARHLRINIGDQPTRVLPGNYYVLRNCRSPAVLCEPSFLTNPQVESKLKLADKQRLEAEVYFIALLDYFGRGIPAVESFSPRGRVEEIDRIEIAFEASPPIDPSSARIEIDDLEIKPIVTSDHHLLGYPPSDLSNGTHSVRASVRSVEGNSSPIIEWTFVLDRQPGDLHLRLTPEVGRHTYPQRITALVLDSEGMPVIDSTRVVFAWQDGSYTTWTIRGQALAYTLKDIPAGTASVRVESGRISQDLKIVIDDECSHVSGFVLTSDPEPLARAIVIDPSNKCFASTDANGFFYFDERVAFERLKVLSPGFKSSPRRATDPYPVLEVEPFYQSLATRPRVMIDPRGGSDNPGWITRDGITAAQLNLEVARSLENLLRQAGLEAHLTRSDDYDIPKQQRVRLTENFGASLLISIGHRSGNSPSVIIEHYPGSTQGKRLAHAIGDQLDPSRFSFQIGETADYVVQQTSCPAVSLTFRLSDSLVATTYQLEAYLIQKRSYPVFCGIIDYSGIGKTFDLSGTVYRRGEPVRHAVVWVDGCLSLITDGSGNFEVRLLEKGSHEIFACSDGDCSQPYRVDSEGKIRIDLE